MKTIIAPDPAFLAHIAKLARKAKRQPKWKLVFHLSFFNHTTKR